jgi:hypothetical protein
LSSLSPRGWRSSGHAGLSLRGQPGVERPTGHQFDLRQVPEDLNLRAQAVVDLPGTGRMLPGCRRARRAGIPRGVPDRVLGVLGAITRQTLSDNLVYGRIDQDPSVRGGQLRGHQDVRALNDVRLGQLDRLLDQLPAEGVEPRTALGLRPPIAFRQFVFHQQPEVRIVIEAMHRELQLAR